MTALDQAVASVRRLAGRFTTVPPRENPADPNGRYLTPGEWFWTDAFWAGQLWTCHDLTADPEFAAAAARVQPWVAAVLDGTQQRQPQHDVGFLFEHTFARAYDRTGDEAARTEALRGADFLIARATELGVIPAWNRHPDRTIIDSIMNLGLLWWAAREAADPRYSRVAVAHAVNVADRMVRPDGSTCHVFDFAAGKQSTHQGLSATSCWSRGQAWAVHGLTTAYTATGRPDLLTAARLAADFAVDRAPAGVVPMWDYDAAPGDPRDSSAAAILADGLQLLADATGHAGYRDHAHQLLNALADGYDCAADPNADGLLLHGCRGKDADVQDGQLPYGDHFYLAALAKASAR